MNPALFSSNLDLWETPQKFFEELDKEFHFTLDACATPQNAKCKRFFTEQDNALVQDWGGEVVFCNPPYSRKGGQDLFVKKAFEESQKPGTTIVMLLPARTDTERFHKFIWGGTNKTRSDLSRGGWSSRLTASQSSRNKESRVQRHSPLWSWCSGARKLLSPTPTGWTGC